MSKNPDKDCKIIEVIYRDYENRKEEEYKYCVISEMYQAELFNDTFKGIGYIISGTSLGFFAIDIINLSVVQKNTLKRSFNEKIGITSLTGIFLGISITFIKKKYFKNKGLNRIRSKTIF